MLDGKRYLRLLSGYRLVEQRCPHCGASTYSSSGRLTFCNFCEQPVNLSQGGQTAESQFAPIMAQVESGDWAAALKSAEQLAKGNNDPMMLYLLGVLYRNASTAKFQSKDYNLMGFMEQNAGNIRESLDLTMKWKEYFFKAIKVIGTELQGNMQVDPELVFVKFMSEIRLQKLVDAASTLRSIQILDKNGAVSEYALLVYSAEKNTKQADASLGKALENGEINAYYYLAKYLAKHGKLAEAEAILQKLGTISEVSMSQELLYRIKLTQEASKM